MRWGWIFCRIKSAAIRLAAWVSPRPVGMIGTPPSGREISASPELHALDFAERYAEPLNYHAEQTMIDLGIDEHKIGGSAPLFGIQHATFHWRERTGGGVSPDGRLTLDSGIFNTELLTQAYGEDVAEIWRRMRLKSRMEAITAHELAESEARDHEEALILAARTPLPVSEEARELLRAMRNGWRWT